MDLFFGVIGGILDNVLVVGNNDCNNDENMECRLFELNVERRFNQFVLFVFIGFSNKNIEIVKNVIFIELVSELFFGLELDFLKLKILLKEII